LKLLISQLFIRNCFFLFFFLFSAQGKSLAPIPESEAELEEEEEEKDEAELEEDEEDKDEAESNRNGEEEQFEDAVVAVDRDEKVELSGTNINAEVIAPEMQSSEESYGQKRDKS